MSGTTLGLAAAAVSPLVTILIRTPRAIGNIYPDVVMSESQDDVLVVTKHPVEKTAAIADHAYKQPVQATIQARWSDASLQAVASLFTGGDILGVLTDGMFGSISYSKQQYDKLVTLMDSKVPITVVTGKRRMPSCLITRIHNVTDRHTEYSLALDISIEQVILVSTSSTTLPPSTNLAAPQQTASPTPSGTLQSAVSSPQSLLLQGANSGGVVGTVLQGAQSAQTAISGALGLGGSK